MKGAKRLHGTSLAMLALSMPPPPETRANAETATTASSLPPSVYGLRVVVADGTGAATGRSPGMVDEFFEPGPLRVFRPAPPPALKAWGSEVNPLQPLNALGARTATLALRFGLARLLEIHPRTDEGRRWGVAVKRTKAERQQAALQAMREDAMIAAAVATMRDGKGGPAEYIAENDEQLLGKRSAGLDDTHVTT